MASGQRLHTLHAHLRQPPRTTATAATPAKPPLRTATPSAAAARGIAATSDSTLALKQFIEFGFCILEGAIPPGALPALRQSAEATAKRHDGWHYEMYPEEDVPAGRNTVSQYLWHVGGVLRHDQSFAPHVASPPVMALMEQAFDTSRAKLLITFTTLQVNRPGMDLSGKGAGGWHSDGYLESEEPYPVPDDALPRPGHINCLFFLSDFTVANGGTWMIPKSHRLPESATPQNSWGTEELDLPHPQVGGCGIHHFSATVSYTCVPRAQGTLCPAMCSWSLSLPVQAVHVTGPAGACCLMDCRVHHCTPPNTSDANRVGDDDPPHQSLTPPPPSFCLSAPTS